MSDGRTIPPWAAALEALLHDAEGRIALMTASIRYLDTFAKFDGEWLFAERRLHVDCTDTRAIGA